MAMTIEQCKQALATCYDALDRILRGELDICFGDLTPEYKQLFIKNTRKEIARLEQIIDESTNE